MNYYEHGQQSSHRLPPHLARLISVSLCARWCFNVNIYKMHSNHYDSHTLILFYQKAKRSKYNKI